MEQQIERACRYSRITHQGTREQGHNTGWNICSRGREREIERERQGPVVGSRGANFHRTGVVAEGGGWRPATSELKRTNKEQTRPQLRAPRIFGSLFNRIQEPKSSRRVGIERWVRRRSKRSSLQYSVTSSRFPSSIRSKFHFIGSVKREDSEPPSFL